MPQAQPGDYPLTPDQTAHLDDTRQPALWGCLTVFLIINNAAIAGRLWATWKTGSRHMPVKAEGISIVISGMLLNVIIGNLMAATHYGLGLHYWTVNARDVDYPRNLSKTFMHVWITMVLMSSFFVCIKITLLFFYKRLFLVSSSRLRIFWWANLIYVVLWFFGGTGFYLFQCQPVQWYFMQHYERFGKPVPGGMTGQCDAQKVTNVALPVIFSLISDLGLLVLPIAAIWNLRLSRWKKIGLFAVFGIGLLACLLELARILALLLDTDDKTDPSYGVANFLILTAAEETCAVVCACLPVIGPQAYRYLKRTVKGSGDGSYRSYASHNHYMSPQLATWHSSEEGGFQRFGSENYIIAPTPDVAGGRSSAVGASKMGDGDGGVVPLQTVVVAGRNPSDHHGDGESLYDDDALRPREQPDLRLRGTERLGQASPSPPPGIHVRTEVHVVHSSNVPK
ncbi:hypothetical protein C7999DRAFT_40490 [Corynascus novoguineensis]|uniref:Rhodopsin domain-containing protein n=1 Tax=Corynascus novoguineensis TaxID=1126955 RepID=A0AAN7CUX2_9PEZI|nr:hypothetical protein C7999DRAFT_40490 [Corynascus novoguineensis]